MSEKLVSEPTTPTVEQDQAAESEEPERVRLERWVGTADVEDYRPLTDQQERRLEEALSKLKPGKTITAGRPEAGVKHYGPDHFIFLKRISLNFLEVDRRLLDQVDSAGIRKAFENVYSKADALHESIERLSGSPAANYLLSSSINRQKLECYGNTPKELSNILIEFMQDIKAFLPHIKGKSGRWRDGVRIQTYIKNLGSLYRDITGRKPSKKGTKKSTSFIDFVKECMVAVEWHIEESTISTHIANTRKQGEFPGFKAAFTSVIGPLGHKKIPSNAETP
jgi:hypothetical protein